SAASPQGQGSRAKYKQVWRASPVCIATKSDALCPLWVNRFTSTSRWRPRNVRFTPNSDRTLALQRNAALCHKQTYAAQQKAPLFDHLVGEQLQRVGHLDAEQSRRLRVDDELEFARLQDRQVGGLRAFEDLPGVDGDMTRPVRAIDPVAHQPAGFDSLASAIGRGNPIVRRQRH